MNEINFTAFILSWVKMTKIKKFVVQNALEKKLYSQLRTNFYSYGHGFFKLYDERRQNIEEYEYNLNVFNILYLVRSIKIFILKMYFNQASCVKKIVPGFSPLTFLQKNKENTKQN